MATNGRSLPAQPLVVAEKDNKKSAIDRIHSVEGYFGELCTLTSSFIKKSATIRDKYDDFGRVIRHIGEVEASHGALSESLINYAKVMTLMADVKDIEVQRMQTKVVLELAAYETFCKNQKDALKHSISLREKEASRQQQLDQMRQRSQSRGRVPTADNNNDAVAVASTSSLAKSSAADVDELVRRFEVQKVQDVKSILLNLTAIQLKQHAKSIELLTAAYQDIMDIDDGALAENTAQKTQSKDEQSLKLSHRSQSVDTLSSLANGLQLRPKGLSTQSMMELPKAATIKALVPPSPNASVDSSMQRSRDGQTDTQTESDDGNTDDDSEDSRTDDEDDGDSESAISDQRKIAAPPVPQVRLSKLKAP